VQIFYCIVLYHLLEYWTLAVAAAAAADLSHLHRHKPDVTNISSQHRLCREWYTYVHGLWQMLVVCVHCVQ